LKRSSSAAAELALEVLAWASGGLATRPQGRTDEAEIGLRALLSPPPALSEAASALASIHAARLGFSAPPLGDARPLGHGALVLAVAVGYAFAPPVALALLEVCPAAEGAWDLVLRDAIASRALACPLDGALIDALRVASPLSSALDRPAPGLEDASLETIDRLARQADGRRVVVHAFAEPRASSEARRFRAFVMERLRLMGDFGRELVLDVYEAALVFHHERVMSEVADACAGLARASAGNASEEALAVAAYFGPLARLRRASPEALRQRRYLELQALLEATRLHHLGYRLLGELL